MYRGYAILTTSTYNNGEMRMNEVTAYGILKALKEADCGLSAKGIAQRANIDTTSENLRDIETECWGFSESLTMRITDLRDDKGPLFFELV